VRNPYSSGKLDVWPAFTDFVTSVSLLLVLLLALAPWFLTSEILTPRFTSAGGSGTADREPFNPWSVLEERKQAMQQALRRVPGILVESEGQEQRIIFQEEPGRDILFASGNAAMKPDFRRRLEPLRNALSAFLDQGYLKRIEVEGHSDADPFQGGEETNWSLSARRAVSVAGFLMSDPKHPIPPWLMTAKGYGEYRPAGFRETPTGIERDRVDYSFGVPRRSVPQYRYIVERNRDGRAKARNRRIEVLLFYWLPRDPGSTLKDPDPEARSALPAGPPRGLLPERPGPR